MSGKVHGSSRRHSAYLFFPGHNQSTSISLPPVTGIHHSSVDHPGLFWEEIVLISGSAGLKELMGVLISEKWKWSHSVVSDSSRPHGLQPTKLLCPWNFPGKSTGVGCHCLLQYSLQSPPNRWSRLEAPQSLCCPLHLLRLHILNWID